MSSFVRFHSLDEVDFPELFAASLQAMDNGTYAWPLDDMTADDKYDFVRQHATAILDLEGGFGYRGEIGGVDVSVGTGLLRDGAFIPCVGLLHPDAGGSRAFLYDPGWLALWRSFLRDNGVTRISMTISPDSAIYKKLSSRHDMTQATVGPSNAIMGSRGDVTVEIPLDAEKGAGIDG